MVAKAKPIGRPSDFTPEVAALILEKIAEGESLRSICKDEALPSRESVRRWLLADETFRGQYALAREEQADAKFEQAWEIADAATAADVQVARLKVDTIKWQASKLAPKVYGEKIEQNVNHGVQDTLRDMLTRIDGKSRGLPG